MKQLIHSSMALIAALSLFRASHVAAQQLDPFVVRAPLDPYRIFQLPDFMVHSRARSDVIMQRAVFTPGVGGWHTHPGVRFAYVVQGHIQLQKYSPLGDCYFTRVYGPGDVYIKPADELHRAIVLGDQNEIEMIVRLNFPEGGAIGIPAADPGCPIEGEFPVSGSLPPVSVQQIGPFLYRGTLDPYQVHQLPDFLMHSTTASDIVIQRSVFPSGAGAWHTHPGPSYVYVVSGQIKLQEFDEESGCTETPVYGPGQSYFEVGEHVHRAVVVGESSAVLIVARFNIPVGAPITTPIPDPGCQN